MVHGWRIDEHGAVVVECSLEGALEGAVEGAVGDGTRARPPMSPVRFAERIGFGALGPQLAPTLAEGGPRGRALSHLLDHLAVVVSLSYWKAAAPQVIELRSGEWTDEDLRAHAEIVAGGFGEFAWANGLDPRPAPRWELTGSARRVGVVPALTGLGLDRGPLVPVGGGKDSCVTAEALRAAGVTPTLVTVNRYPRSST